MKFGGKICKNLMKFCIVTSQLVSHWCRRNVVSQKSKFFGLSIVSTLGDTTSTRHGDLIVSTLCDSDTTATFLRHFCATIVSAVLSFYLRACKKYIEKFVKIIANIGRVHTSKHQVDNLKIAPKIPWSLNSNINRQ